MLWKRLDDINELNKEDLKKTCINYIISKLAYYLDIDIGDNFIKYRNDNFNFLIKEINFYVNLYLDLVYLINI